MNKKEVKKFKERLLAERQRILSDLNGLHEDTLNRSPRDSSGNLSDYSTHIADTADEDYVRSFNLDLASNKQQQLQEVDEALDKIEEKNYGVCKNCGKNITLKRLRAKPSARYCLKCVRQLEEEGLL